MTQKQLEIIIGSSLSAQEKAKLITSLFPSFQNGGKAEKGVDINKILKQVNDSEANFVERLKNKERKHIDLGDGSVGTHKMSYATLDDGRAIVYANIQEIDGQLYDLSKDPKAAMQMAKENGDYVILDSEEDAEWFTENYKDHYKFDQYDNIQKQQSGGRSAKILRPTETIIIGNKEYDVEIADTPQKREDGLSRVRKLSRDEGMLFVFDRESTDYFTMKDTSINLDIIFIDSDGDVISVKTVRAFDKKPVVCERPYKFVLEVNANSGIKKGDDIDFDDEDFTEEEASQVKKSRMLVLNSDGDVQMKLVGGERIVSMIKTRQLIKAALKAYKTDNDSDYRRVGKLIFNELDAQDGRDPQYVSK